MNEIGVGLDNFILVLNKIDAVEDRALVDILRRKYVQAVTISAAQGIGLDKLSALVAELLASAAELAVAQASMRLLRAWQPETGMVLYRPKTITTPPAANIRLMPVTEHIVEGLSSESERSQYWFWLSPRGAARLNIAVGAFERAMQDVEQERRGRAGS